MKQIKENMEMQYGKHLMVVTVSIAGTQITLAVRTLAVRSSCVGALTTTALVQVRSISTSATDGEATTIRSVSFCSSRPAHLDAYRFIFMNSLNKNKNMNSSYINKNKMFK